MQMERLSEERKREKRKRENKPDSRLASVSCFSRSGSVAAKNRREKKSFFFITNCISANGVAIRAIVRCGTRDKVGGLNL